MLGLRRHMFVLILSTLKKVLWDESRSPKEDDREQFTMGDIPTEMAPAHLDGGEPGAVGREVKQDESPRCCPHHSLHFVILMGAGMVPGTERVPVECLSTMA